MRKQEGMAGFFHIPSDHWLEVDFSRWGEGGKRDGEKFALLKYAAIHHQKAENLPEQNSLFSISMEKKEKKGYNKKVGSCRKESMEVIDMFDEISRRLREESSISMKEMMGIVNAVMQVYPMIILANLTKNTFTMVRDEGFLYSDLAFSGCYDDMIEDGVQNIHSNYQKLFLRCFSRENLLRNYGNGKNEVYAELYQKDRKGEYHWVSVHVIKIENEMGDVMQICLNRILDKVSVNEYGQRK